MWAPLCVAVFGWFVVSHGAGTTFQVHEAYAANEQLRQSSGHTLVTPAPASLERIKEVLVNIEFELGELKAYLFGSALTDSVQLKHKVVERKGAPEFPQADLQSFEYIAASNLLVPRGGPVNLEHKPPIAPSNDPNEDYIDDVLIFS